MTTVGMLVGLTAAALYATGAPALVNLGGVVWLLSAVLDHADGELARLSGKSTAWGAAYDRNSDLLVRLALFTGIGIGLRDGALGLAAPLCGLAAGVAFVAIFGIRGAIIRRRGRDAVEQPAVGGFELEDILYLIAPLTWLGGLAPFLVAAAIGAPLYALWAARGYRAAVAPGGALLTPMADAQRMPATALVTPGLLVGAALFVAVLTHHGVAEVGAALAAAGPGLLVVSLFHLVPMLGDALGWRALFGPFRRPRVSLVLLARWIGESVNGLLPVLQMGGNIAKARVLHRRGVPGAVAGASVVVDVTVVVATQVVFTLVGLALLLEHLGFTRLTLAAAAGAAATTALLVVTFVVQRRAPFTFLARMSGRLVGGDVSASAAALDVRVVELYRDRRAILTAAGWHLGAWFVGAGEVWLALAFLGHPVPLHTAVLLESLGQAVRTGFFVVPAALGVQEGGLVLLGGALGLAPETALALSLTRRVRDVVLGLPGLAAWQLVAALDAGRARSEVMP